jgi:hypothetical protein
LDTFENVDKGDDYYRSEARIRFAKQKNGSLWNCVREVLVPSKNQIAIKEPTQKGIYVSYCKF